MTEREWLATLKEPILVMGNGSLVIKIPERGYASVVRINNYELGGKSGDRVTHWVASGYRDIEERPVPQVLIPWSMEYQRRPRRYDLSFRERIHSQVVHLSRCSHIQRWFPNAMLRWKYFPSVGFCFLAWLNDRGIQPDIAGFDGMRTGHHNNPSHLHGHLKTRNQEWLVIQEHFIRKDLNRIGL